MNTDKDSDCVLRSVFICVHLWFFFMRSNDRVHLRLSLGAAPLGYLLWKPFVRRPQLDEAA
jgi:hypothetical protein